MKLLARLVSFRSVFFKAYVHNLFLGDKYGICIEGKFEFLETRAQWF